MNITILPNEVTYLTVAELRITAERGCDPALYELAAKGFDALNMPSAAARMRERRDYYFRVNPAE